MSVKSQLSSIADVQHVKHKVKQDNRGDKKRNVEITKSALILQSRPYCGRTHPRSREKCPSVWTFNKCGEQNHFEKEIPHQRVPIVAYGTVESNKFIRLRFMKVTHHHLMNSFLLSNKCTRYHQNVIRPS